MGAHHFIKIRSRADSSVAFHFTKEQSSTRSMAFKVGGNTLLITADVL